MKRTFLLFLSAAMLAAGCAGHEVETSTYAAETLPAAGFPGDTSFAVQTNADAQNEIFDRTVKRKIETVLKSEGYEVTTPENADYLVRYAYDIHGEVRTRPAYVPTSSYPFAHTYFVHGRRFHWSPYYAGGLRYRYYVNEPYNVYVMRFRLRVLKPAVDEAGREIEKPGTVWVGETQTESQERDLREMINYLLAASFRHFGQDTQTQREMRLTEEDPLLRILENEIQD